MEFLLGAVAIVFLIGLWMQGFLWSMVLGAVIGSFFGLAGFGGAVSGMIPGAVIGGIIAVALKKGKQSEGSK